MGARGWLVGRPVALLCGVQLLAGCAGAMQGEHARRDVGAVTGGVIGALLGHQVGGGQGRFAATALGAIVGTYLGHQVGDDLDRLNQQRVADALTHVPDHQTTTWRDPKHGYDVSLRPQATFRRHHRLCRRYTTSVLIDGRLQTAEGVACRRGRGPWRLEHARPTTHVEVWERVDVHPAKVYVAAEGREDD